MDSRNSGRLAAWALLGAVPFSPLHAAPTLDLEQHIVTASRLAETADQSLAAVTVIDRAEIERSQANSLQQLLAGVPGVALASYGGAGKNASLYLRGSNASHVLVLVDGIQVGSATLGTVAFQDLPLELIERIEVVRGPRSSLYGSEAIGGVVQIFTRRQRSDGIKPFFSAGYGSHDSYEGTAGLSGASTRGWYTLAANGSDTDGINAKAKTAASLADGSYESDSDGYRRLSASARAGYRFDNGLELEGTYLRADAHNDFDGRYEWNGVFGKRAFAENTQQVLGARARFSPLQPWDVTLQLGRSQDNADTYQDGAFYSRFDNRRDSATWQNDLALAERQTLTLGLDYQRDEVNGTTNYLLDNRENEGVFLQYRAGLARHELQLAARHDRNEQFGSHKTGSVAWGYALTDALRVTTSYGSAFKAPTFNDLYFPGYGNPMLEPERSRSLEAGLSGEHAWGNWSANLFRSQIENLIAAVCDSNFDCTAEGVDRARIRGLELAVASQLWAWRWNANYTLIDARNRSARYYGNALQRRPEQLFNLSIDRDIGPFGMGATLHAQGAAYDDQANSRVLPGFATLDLRGEYRVNREWRLQARIANLLDTDYQTVADYNQPGRAVYLTIRYQAL